MYEGKRRMKEKMTQLISKVKKIYGDVFNIYPITMILVIITTLFGCVFVSLEECDICSSAQDILNGILTFLLYFSAGCFGIEALPKKFFASKHWIKKTVGICIMAAISATLAILGHIDTARIIENQLPVWSIAYLVLILLDVVYCRYKDSGASLEKYFVSVLSGTIQVLITWGIIAIGILIMTLIFDSLIVSVNSAGLAIPHILIIGLYVAPFVMMTFTDVKDEITKFFENLIKYVLLVLTVIGAVIIYIYIIKTIFTGIPSNEIFSITSALFFVAIPVGFACTAFAKDSIGQKVAYILPYIYAPFIILQAYSVFTRIHEYGVTPSRYMGVVLIVLELMYTVIYAVSKKNVDKMIIVMMVITLIAAVIPGVNANAVSAFSQKQTINRYIKNGMPSDKTKQKRLVGAYNYISIYYGREYVSELLSDKQIEDLEAIDYTEPSDDSRHFYLYGNDSIIETDGYDIVAGFWTSYVENDEPPIDPKEIYIQVDAYKFGPFDLSEEFESIIKRCGNDNSVDVKTGDIVKVAPECELFITQATLCKNMRTNEYDSVQLNGYILCSKNYLEMAK